MSIRYFGCTAWTGMVFLACALPLAGQDGDNCFLADFVNRYAAIPAHVDAQKPSASPTITVTMDPADTLGKISPYIFGNALASWLGNDVINPVLLQHIQALAPTLIRYPGGSWSDIFFWSGNPGNLPDSVVDGTNGRKKKLEPQYGTGSWPTTVDNYYLMRESVYSQGLITINYAYARYGLGPNPVEQAAHLAAEWVRYDDGRTLFWEIGNENAGPWEEGWQIDTTVNEDGQPSVITGELYGKHFKIFADSMRTAAEEVGSPIWIGGQIIHYDGTNSWNVADREWNAGFFREVGDTADFYVIHNYFGTSTAAKSLLDQATTIPKENIGFIRQDIAAKGAASRPVAITEYNMTGGAGYDLAKTSIINGMQAVILFCEMIELNYGMSSRWLLANWESDGMFYKGNNTSIPAWNPRPEFFYLYYLPKFVGDASIATVRSSGDIMAYASKFYSGHAGLVVVNKSKNEHVVKLDPMDFGVGERYYVYSLKGGSDNGDFSQYVYVNENGPEGSAWGPLDGLEDIPAWAYAIGDEIKFTSPPRSVQFILVEPGEHIISAVGGDRSATAHAFALFQNHPNPFNPATTIGYTLTRRSRVRLAVYDMRGREVAVLEDGIQDAGLHEMAFSGVGLHSGVYVCRLQSADGVITRKMVFLK